MDGRVSLLIHYYYGDRIRTFHTGLGSLIRAAGHSKKILAYIIDDSLNWLDSLKDNLSIPVNILSIVQDKNIQKVIFDGISSIRDHVCLISNIDLLIDSGLMSVNELLNFLTDIKGKNEIILSCQSYYPELETEADYVSLFKVKNV